jgi:hypothetical protein
MLDSFIHLADEALTAIALVLTIGEKLVPVSRRVVAFFKKSSNFTEGKLFLKKPCELPLR